MALYDVFVYVIQQLEVRGYAIGFLVDVLDILDLFGLLDGAS